MAGCRPAGMSDEDTSDEDYYDTTFPGYGKKTKKKPNTSQHFETSGSAGPSGQQKSKLTFWQRKEKAFENYGAADTRPQDEYREFLLHRRQLNNGSQDFRWNTNSQVDTIQRSGFPPEVFDENISDALPNLYENSEMIVVNSQSLFQQMMEHLYEEMEITLDMEGNDEHSFLGMTCLIQIGTNTKDYMIDIFPILELVKTQLKAYLEDPGVLKYVFGGSNDILWLKRCFFIDIVQVCDVQLVFQKILMRGYFTVISRKIPMATKKPWYLKYIGARTKVTPSSTYGRWEQLAGEQGMGFVKLVELFYPNADVNKDAQIADFRPRDLEETNYRKLLKYARDDVHILFRIVMFLKGNLEPDVRISVFSSAFQSTKKMLTTVYKRPAYPNISGLLPIARQKQIDIDLFRTIYEWRTHMCKIIDEGVDSTFTATQLMQMMKSQPKDLNDLKLRTATRFKIAGKFLLVASESFDRWGPNLLNLIMRGRSYYDEIMSKQCNNCRQIVGHIAWGCPEPHSKENSKLFLVERPELKNKVNNSRQYNKRHNKADARNASLGLPPTDREPRGKRGGARGGW